MGLFDFLDLEGETGAWDMAGAGAEGWMKGTQAGSQMGISEQAALNDAVLQRRKLDLQDLELRKASRLAPLEELIMKQKVNRQAPPATREDLDQAILEVTGKTAEDLPALNAETKEKIQMRADELARARMPMIDLDDLSTLELNPKTEYELALEKQAIETKQFMLREEAKRSALERRLEEARIEREKAREFAKTEKGKDRGLKKTISDNTIGAANMRQAERLADQINKQAARTLGGYGNPKGSKRALQEAVRYHDQIIAAGVPGKVQEFRQKYGDLLREAARQGITGAPVVMGKPQIESPKGPRVQSYVPGKKYKEGDIVEINGGLRKRVGGGWQRVK